MLDFDKFDGVFKSNIRLMGSGGEAVSLELDEEGTSLLRSRLSRSFFKVTGEERLICLIEDASDTGELEGIAKKYYLCDLPDLTDVNLYGAKKLLKVIATALYRYPMLRSQLCFVGTYDKYKEHIDALCLGDADALRRFGLQYLCDLDTAKKLGALIKGELEKTNSLDSASVAMAFSGFGLFDALLINNASFEGYGYIKTANDIRYSERVGFHPKGCDTVESVIFHEVGHLLDYTCEVTKSEEFSSYYNKLGEKKIKTELSEYAITSPAELFAEAVAEYYCSHTPGEIAVKTVEILDKLYLKRSKI